MEFTCWRCAYTAKPERQYNQNAKIWYQGCGKCGCGVFMPKSKEI